MASSLFDKLTGRGPKPVMLADLTPRDRNPLLIARALKSSLAEARDTAGVRRFIPGVLAGFTGLALIGAAPVLAGAVIAASGLWMGVETLRGRARTLPQIRAQFKAACGMLQDDSTLRPAAKVLDDAIAATETLRDDFNPLRHPFRAPSATAITVYGVAMGLPATAALGVFFMAAAMLDTHSDHLKETHEKVTRSLQHLRP